ncbi:MAG: right-handed parallel beta-helix repeat-containing protein [Acidobacteriia bacterium]|nr:right-handed parallel beta-helix repeat-containing protein [Terriglobia bacterium]
MKLRLTKMLAWAGLALSLTLMAPWLRAESSAPVFNVRNYGATGQKPDNATSAIQKAVDACAKAGGGTVFLPAGEYTSGIIRLRSHVRLYLDAGATLFASTDPAAFDKPALLYGEDLQNIAIEGRGTVDGQAEYMWKQNDLNDYFIRDNQLMMESLGKPTMRSFPMGYPTRTMYPHLVQLLRCKDIKITGLRFLHSPSWTINAYGCERWTIDGIYIYSDQKYGVWADGIDPDGCKDVIIANSTIETGDDAIVFYSMNWYGPALPCENITITNCRLSSASSALKFCDGNMNCVRNVVVDNCIITGANRGIAFMVYDGGYVDNVILSNLVVNTKRYDWFWWGNGDPIYFVIRRRSENEGKPPKPGEPPAGSIRNVIIRNVIAHGKGSCLITGHPESWLQNISMENVRFFLSTDPEAPYDRSVNAMYFRYARDLKLRDVEVTWEKPELSKWQSVLYFQDVEGLKLDGFAGEPAKKAFPTVILEQVEGATICNSLARPGTQTFVSVKGAKSRGIYLVGNELHDAGTPYRLEAGANAGSVKLLGNF